MDLQVWRSGISGNQLGRETFVSQVDGAQIRQPPTSVHQDGGGLNKETMESARTSVREKATSLALTVKPDNSISPCISLALIEQLP